MPLLPGLVIPLLALVDGTTVEPTAASDKGTVGQSRPLVRVDSSTLLSTVSTEPRVGGQPDHEMFPEVRAVVALRTERDREVLGRLASPPCRPVAWVSRMLSSAVTTTWGGA